jgi:hypothetical protein
MLKDVLAFAQVARATRSLPPRAPEPAERHSARSRGLAVPSPRRQPGRRRQLRLFAARRLAAVLPETSGYIATTFFRLARDRDPSFLERAQRILRWLVSIQNADGSFCNPRYGRDGIVFDTGQVLFGLVRGYEVSGDRRCCRARGAPPTG